MEPPRFREGPSLVDSDLDSVPTIHWYPSGVSCPTFFLVSPSGKRPASERHGGRSIGTLVRFDGEGVMVLLVLVAASVTLGVLAGLAVRTWPAADPAADISRSLGRQLQQGHRLRFLRARFDPATATGLALTAALTCVVVGGVVAGVLFYVVRSRGALDVDTAVANWAARHATSLFHDGPACAYVAWVHDGCGRRDARGGISRMAADPEPLAVALPCAGGGWAAADRQSDQTWRGAGSSNDRSARVLLRFVVPERAYRCCRILLRGDGPGHVSGTHAAYTRGARGAGGGYRGRRRNVADASRRPLVHRCHRRAGRGMGLVRALCHRDGWAAPEVWHGC